MRVYLLVKRIVETEVMFDLTTIENEVKVQGLTVAAAVEQLSVIDYLLWNCSYALMRPEVALIPDACV